MSTTTMSAMIDIDWPFQDTLSASRWTLHAGEEMPTELRVVFDTGVVDDAELLRFHADDGTARIRLCDDAHLDVELDVRSVNVRTVDSEVKRQRAITFRLRQSLDGGRKTRSFAPQAAGQCTICDCVGLQPAFSSVEGLELLDVLVSQVTQFEETDIQFLGRLAAMSGRYLTHSKQGVLRITSDAPPSTPLPLSGVIRERVTWEVAASEQQRGAATWNEDEDTVDRKMGIPSRVDPLALAALNIGVSNNSSDFVKHVFSDRDPARLAELEARRNRDTVFYWKGALRRSDIAVGDVVTLPNGLAFAGDELRVITRELSFDERRSEDQLLNIVELKPARGLRKLPFTETLHMVKAKVVHLNDKTKLGLVAIQLPWQADGEFVMATNLQRTSKAFSMPEKHDWTIVLMQPFSFARPVVLGSIFRAGVTAPLAKGDQLVSWQFAGCEVRYDNQAKKLIVMFEGGVQLEICLSDVHVSGGDFKIVDGKLILE